MKKLIATLLSATLLIGIVCLSGCRQGSPLVTGKWDGNAFANSWTQITFELPPELHARPVDNSNSPPGQKTDFTLANEDNSAVISLFYIDVTANGDTAEDYLNTTREQLAGSPNRVYTFSEDFESAIIAGRKYSLMRTEFVNNNEQERVVRQDGYAYRFVDTMIVFIAVYSDEKQGLVDSFFESIKSA